MESVPEKFYTSKVENSFYDIYQISEKDHKTCNEILGIEADKTAEQLYEELQNK